MTRSRTRSRAAAAAGRGANTSDNGERIRRSTRARTQRVILSTDSTQHDSFGNSSDNDDDDAYSNESDEEILPVRRKSYRSTAFCGGMKDPPNDDASEGASYNEFDEEVVPVRHKSYRSTVCRGGMKDPSIVITERLRPVETAASSSTKGKRTGATKAASARRSSLESKGGDPDSDEEMCKSPLKEEEVSEYEDSGADPEEKGDNEKFRIDKIIACKSMTLKEWKVVSAKMNTTEVTNGSRWNQKEESARPSKYEERFLVKWNDLSFLHCSWETEKDLVKLCERAKGRLSTFFRKEEGGVLYEADERLDGDYFDPSWVTIERILEATEQDDDDPAEIILDVNHPNFDSGTGREFYVKWANKPYSESSFEFERDLILNEVEYKEHLALYNQRTVKPTKKDMQRGFNECDAQAKKLYKVFGDKIKQSDEKKEELVKEYQNALVARVFKNGGQLRDYQAEGVSWLMSNHLNKRSSILADEMGLGKTIQTATYVYSVSQQLATRGPFLIVAPLSTIPHWYREFTGWTDLNTIIYHGSANDRKRAREDEFAFPDDRVQDVAFNQRYLHKVAKKWRGKWEKTWMVEVVITTPEMLVTEDFAELAAVKWEVLVVDEAHRLKNHNSKLAQNLRDDRFEFKHSLLLTGTPIQNNMQELWTLLNFVNPDDFDNLDEFMESYGDIKSKEKVDELHETIRPYILRRLKEDVEKSVPPKEETLIEVELTVLQKQYYRALYEKNLKFLHRNKKKPCDGPSINNLAMQLRKCCNHPFLLTGVETEVRAQNPNADAVDSLVNASGKFVLLDKLLPRMKTDGHRILLFSQFKIMLDIIEDYLHLRNFKCERIDGSITGLKRQAAIDRFQSKDSGGREQPFIMLLSTRAGGVGINLTAADTCIIFDSDWNPQNDLQAQARCHRIGQTKNVKIYRLLTRKTYEMQMFHMSSMKMGLDQAVLQGIENNDKEIMTKDEVEKLLKHGAYDIFKEDQDGTSEKESNDFVSQDIDSILARRAKKVVHENTGSNSNAAGGTFSKASFKNTNSDGVAAAEVDVDDPDFWTKVVGEAKEEEDEELGKRKRVQQSYSEKEYFKRLDAQIRDGVEGSDVDDNASLSSDYSDQGEKSDDDSPDADNETLRKIVKTIKSKKKDERYLWGGSTQTEWKQCDAENVLKSLQSFGYGNISWPQHNAWLTLSKPMKLEEIKRMSWALALVCLYEAAEDDALEVTRKADAASKEKQTEGDILARTGDDGAINADKEPNKNHRKQEGVNDQVEESFRKLLTANESWAVKALADALAFSKTIAFPRDKQHVQSIIDGNRPSKIANESNTLQSKLAADFNENVWPALRSRGWKNDEKKKSQSFAYQGKTFNSLTAVLDAIPKYHPELMNMTNSLIASVAEACKISAGSGLVATLDLNNVTAKSLRLFLMDCAPLQLLADRKRAHRVGLSKRLLARIVSLGGVHKVVTTADSSLPLDASIEEKNSGLSKLININPRASLPHPEWTLLHDAILIRAVTKHGWVDSQSTCLAIGNDKTIRWGSPFEVTEEGEKKKNGDVDPKAEEKFQADYYRLFSTASRAIKFLENINETFVDGMTAPVLNETRERLIKSYALFHDESDEKWKVNEDALKRILRPSHGKGPDDCEALPSRKKLIKRMRKLAMSFTGNAIPDSEKDEPPQDNTAGDTKVEAKNYGFHVIDQTDRHNILLAEMVKGQLLLKQATKVGVVKQYTGLLFDEIDARSKDLALSNGNDSLVRDHIQLYFNTCKKGARAAKNILRVMLGKDPVPSKSAKESLFATEDKKQSTSSAAKAALAKLKKKKAFTPADTALNRALSSFVEDKDGVKDCLSLTSTEILTLTVLASQGLPVYLDDWSSALAEVNDQDEDGEDFKIHFSTMGGIMQAAAEVWHSIARKKLETEILLTRDKPTISEKDQKKISVLKKDHDSKEMTLEEAKTYSADPLVFAKKCIMLVEAIRKNMGPVDLQYAGEKKIRQLNKSENGLGTKVLNWFSKDLQRWAGPLGVVDKHGNVISNTSITRAKDHPQSHDAALMTKRDCRTVYIQIAQQTRLRSVFIKHNLTRLSAELIPKVSRQSSFTMSDWEDRPAWWNSGMMEGSSCNCRDDLDLLVGILDYGYGGFDSMLQQDYSFCKHLAAEGNGSSTAFTRSTVQVRINHLTRELHGIDDTEEMMKLVQKKRKGESEKPSVNGKVKKAKSGGGIQSGLQAFFNKSKHSMAPTPTAGSKKQGTPPTSPEHSDIEVIEIDSDSSSDIKKRKHVVDCIGVAGKKQK